MSSMITLTTDFGEGSPYVAQMKGAIFSINPRVAVVDITHHIPPQDIHAAAWVLDDCCWRFPADTIHVAVVDPGVGTERALVAVRVGGHRFVAPDNGLLTHIVRRHGSAERVRLTKTAYWLSDPSCTFHGRDLMAPVAGHLSLGLSLSALGEPGPRLRLLDFPTLEVQPNRVTGSVVAIDSFGNVQTNIDMSHLSADGWEEIQVHCAGTCIRGLIATYGKRDPGTTVALFGSNRRLELAVVNGNAARELKVQVGDQVVVHWPPKEKP